MQILEVIVIWSFVLIVLIAIFIVCFDHMVNKVHRRARERGILLPEIVHEHVAVEMNEERISRAMLFDSTKSIAEPSMARIPIPVDENIAVKYEGLSGTELKRNHSKCPRCTYPMYMCMCHRMKKRR